VARLASEPEVAPVSNATIDKRGEHFFGRGTWYDLEIRYAETVGETGSVACGGSTENNGARLVAINGAQFHGACGRTVAVKNTANGRVARGVTVRDQCPGSYCPFGALDLSIRVFQELDDNYVMTGVVQLEWWFEDEESAPAPPTETWTPPTPTETWTPPTPTETWTPPAETWTPPPETSTWTPPPETSTWTPPPETSTSTWVELSLSTTSAQPSSLAPSLASAPASSGTASVPGSASRSASASASGSAAASGTRSANRTAATQTAAAAPSRAAIVSTGGAAPDNGNLAAFNALIAHFGQIVIAPYH
jgi:hypothetical protein